MSDNSARHSNGATKSRPVKSVRAMSARPEDAVLTRTVLFGQVGFILIVLGVLLAVGVFLSLNFGDPSRLFAEQARLVLRFLGSGVLIVGMLFVSLSAVRSRN